MINNEISRILERQDAPYIYCYNDYTESKNYSEKDSYFHDMTPAQVLAKSTKDAMKHGLTSENIMEYLEGSSAWSVLTEEEKNTIINHFNAKNNESSDGSEEPSKYFSFPLSDKKDICYNESSGEFFTFSPFSKNPIKEHIIRIPIKFNGIVIDDNGDKFINAKINGVSSYFSLEDFKTEIKKYAITGAHLEKIMQFLLAYINDENNIKNAEKVHPDNIFIEKKTIKVSDNYNIDKIKTIKTVFRLYQIATVPDHFAANLAYFLAAPLSYFFRRKGKMFPYLINSGVPGSGKTTIPILFVVKGYNQLDEEAHVVMNDVKTPYTLMKALSRSILPTTQEEVTSDWIQFHSELLKGMADSTHAGSRGYFNTVKHSDAKSQLSMDSNDNISTKVADMDRFIVCNFPKEAREKQNINEFDKVSNELQPGFMFNLFDAVFGGKNLDDVIKNIYSVTNRNEIKKSIIKYVLDALNSLTPEVNFNMPDFNTFKTENNLNDWQAEVYTNLDYIIKQIADGQRLNTYNLNETQIARNDKKIYITRTGFSILKKAINLPFKSIDDFDHNTMSTNFTTSKTSFRFNKDDPPITCLMIAPIESDDPPEIRKLKNEIARLEEVKKELKSQNIETEGIDKTINELNAKIKEIQNPLKIPKEQGTLDSGKDNNNFGKKEPDKDDGKNEEKTDNEDTGDNPSGNSPDPNKSAENETHKKEENKEHKSENPPDTEKTPRIPKNPKMFYYKIMDHFDAYPDSYFDGSDIILESYRPIYHKSSSNISYILVKVLIPENLSQQPSDWMKFLSDSQEISQKQFEVLSRGDAE